MVYHGHTQPEHRPVAVAVRAGAVRSLRVTVARFACETFGDVGPLRIRVRLDAGLGRSGRFHAVAGPSAQRVSVAGRLRHGRITGRLRVRGTIATGAPCRSRALRFSAARSR